MLMQDRVLQLCYFKSLWEADMEHISEMLNIFIVIV